MHHNLKLNPSLYNSLLAYKNVVSTLLRDQGFLDNLLQCTLSLKRVLEDGSAILRISYPFENKLLFHKAIHLQEELIGKFRQERVSYPAICDSDTHSLKEYPFFLNLRLALENITFSGPFNLHLPFPNELPPKILSPFYSLIIHLLLEGLEKDFVDFRGGWLTTSLTDSLQCIEQLLDDELCFENTARIKALLIKEKSLLISACGNGGSLCDAAEFLDLLKNTYNNVIPVPVPDNATLTCIGNDWSFNVIFFRQLTAFNAVSHRYKLPHLILLLSTSGNSTNIKRILDLDDGHKFFLGGKDGGEIGKLLSSKDSVIIPSFSTERIQEFHVLLLGSFLD
jgi:D-sedoheptulose 7-phosphate isomerase